MRVAVRPCFLPGVSGGIEQYVQGLAAALSTLDGDDHFDFVGTEQQRANLAPFISGAARWVTLPGDVTLPAGPALPSRGRQLKIRFANTNVGQLAVRVKRGLRGTPSIPASPPTIEDGGYEVVHFAAQTGEVTARPNLYQPWDLQHLHFPEYFTDDELRHRDLTWGRCCRQATYVVVASEFVGKDVADVYGVDPSRIAVVPPGAPLNALATATTGASPYALFPAQTWSHKNHERLIDAIALLRGRGTEIPLVCPGQPNRRDAIVRAHAHARGVHDLVQFPGYLDSQALEDVYANARSLVFPSLFEGFGFPVLEAFAAGLPVTCSSTTSLPELAGDAAVLFDPTDVEAMADAIERVWTDDRLRGYLVVRGHARATTYSWDHLARSCRALYRAAAGESFGPGDDNLLKAAGVSA